MAGSQRRGGEGVVCSRLLGGCVVVMVHVCEKSASLDFIEGACIMNSSSFSFSPSPLPPLSLSLSLPPLPLLLSPSSLSPLRSPGSTCWEV